MSIVGAKCPSCGANLNVDNSKDAAICDYCGSPYIVEKAINNYHVTNNIQGETVNVYGGSDPDFVIRGGVLVKYNGASLHPVVPEGVVEIYDGVFAGTRIESCEFPESLRFLGDRVFADCLELKKLILPEKLEKINSGYWDWHFTKPYDYDDDTKYYVSCNGCFINCPNLTLEIRSFKQAFSILEKCDAPIRDNISSQYYFFPAFKGVSKLYIEGVEFPSDIQFKGYNVEDYFKKQYSSSNVFVEPKPKKGKGCYITTAVCKSFHKADNCPELTAFRDFRDNWLLFEPDGEKLIEEYYATAPAIVSEIDKNINAKLIYKKIWDTYLSPCLTDLKNSDPISCKSRYMQMIHELQKEYLQ